MGCINSTSTQRDNGVLLSCMVKSPSLPGFTGPTGDIMKSNTQKLLKQTKQTKALAAKVIGIIKEPNQAVSLKKLRQIVEENKDSLDFTSICGYEATITIDDTLQFPTDMYTPVLLALSMNKLELARYLLEEVGLSLPLYLYKPLDKDEMQIHLHVAQHPEDARESKGIKRKQERYNKILSVIIACRYKNRAMLQYLLGFENFYQIPPSEQPPQQPEFNYPGCANSALVRKQLRHFWSKKEVSAMLHFITNNIKIWEFALPIIFESSAAHRWFYEMRDFNKMDIIYRIQRHFNVKILLQEMFHQLY